MKEGYIIREQENIHFITATVVDRVNVSTRKPYKDCIVKAITSAPFVPTRMRNKEGVKYNQSSKGTRETLKNLFHDGGFAT